MDLQVEVYQEGCIGCYGVFAMLYTGSEGQGLSKVKGVVFWAKKQDGPFLGRWGDRGIQKRFRV